MSFYAVAKCMLSGRGSLRRASARGRNEGFVSSGVVSDDEREQVKRSQRSSGDGLDRQDGHLLCSSVACACCIRRYVSAMDDAGARLLPWHQVSSVKGKKDLGHLCLRRLENMNLLTCETLQQRLQTIWSSLGLGHDGRATAPFPWHQPASPLRKYVPSYKPEADNIDTHFLLYICT
jgi:hypothetical protein